MQGTVFEAAKELCAFAENDRQKTEAIVGFVTKTMLYDYLKARTVSKGYRPDPDMTLAERRGICWDFAELVARMLKAVGVRCRVVIGWADDRYHAWNEVWLDGEWMLYDVTATIIGRPHLVYKAQKERS